MERIDPPPTAKSERSEEWHRKIAIMQGDPMNYYKVGNYSPGVPTHIRRGQYKAFLPAGNDFTPAEAQSYMKKHWEMTTRKTDGGKRCDVFLRWLG